MTTAIGVYGSCGKMGRRIVAAIATAPECRFVVSLEHVGHPAVHTEVDGVVVSQDMADISRAAVMIDFTVPAATMALIPEAVALRKPLVIGTTGLSVDQQREIQTAAETIPIVYSPNMSVGVTVVFEMARVAAQKLGDYRVRIVEAHHIHKKDSPSGTAKQLARIVEAYRSSPVTDIEAIREGEIIGDHTLRLESDEDVIELRHSAKSRDIFARGAVRAAAWLVRQTPGLYTMKDVLGI